MASEYDAADNQIVMGIGVGELADLLDNLQAALHVAAEELGNQGYADDAERLDAIHDEITEMYQRYKTLGDAI